MTTPLRNTILSVVLAFSATLLASLAGCGSSGSTGGTGGGSGGSGGSGGASGTGPISAACTATADCQAGLFCSTDDPGGQCLKTCTAQSGCPTGSTCTGEGKCYKTCAAQSDCTRTGYECVDATTIDSKKAATCDIAPIPDSGVVGVACAATSDCTAGLFCSTDDPRGQCLKRCLAATDCPSGSICTDEGKCYATCTVAADCTRTGYTCVDASSLDGGAAKTCDVSPDGGP